MEYWNCGIIYLFFKSTYFSHIRSVIMELFGESEGARNIHTHFTLKVRDCMFSGDVLSIFRTNNSEINKQY